LKIKGETDAIDISDKGIAWDTDIKYKFKNTEESLPEGKTWEDVQWLDMTN